MLASTAVIISMRLASVILVIISNPKFTALKSEKGFEKICETIPVAPPIFSVMTGITISYVTNFVLADVFVIVSIATFLTVLAAKYSTKNQGIVKLEEARS